MEKDNKNVISKKLAATELLIWVRQLKILAIIMLCFSFLSHMITHLFLVGAGAAVALYFFWRSLTREQQLIGTYGLEISNVQFFGQQQNFNNAKK